MKRVIIFIFLYLASFVVMAQPKVRVGSKVFTESYILAEIFSQILERQGYQVERKFGLGATGIAYESLKNSEVDILPEYSGTISQAILKKNFESLEQLNADLSEKGLITSGSLGFNNTYAFGYLKTNSRLNNLKNISDLKKISQLRYGIDHEFQNREDGLGALVSHYGLSIKNKVLLDHNLAYQALAEGEVDVINLYSTDAKIKKFEIVKLQDDLSFFPDYNGVIFSRSQWVNRNQEAWQALSKLQNAISEREMIRLNALVDIEKKTFAQAAVSFLNQYFSENKKIHSKRRFDLIRLTQEHLFLVFFSLLSSILVAVPLGVLGFLKSSLGQLILSLSGLLQTIPSLALLCFLIPWFGIGEPPALMALFLYGLLPIVRNTYVGLDQIESRLKESARSLGLSRVQQLVKVELPLALPSIMAGIKTSAIINVGTATLASFIGAGGYGTPIVTGLALNDTTIMLYGAIPAAILAILIHFSFEMLDKLIISKGLRL